MKRTLESLLVIVVSILLFSSCSGNKIMNTEKENKEYTAVGKLFCEISLSATEEGETLNAFVVKEDLASTCGEMFTSDVFLEKISAETGEKYTLDELRDMISMTYKEDNIIAIEVTADNSGDALAVCESIFEFAPDFVSEKTRGTIKVLEEPHLAD